MDNIYHIIFSKDEFIANAFVVAGDEYQAKDEIDADVYKIISCALIGTWKGYAIKAPYVIYNEMNSMSCDIYDKYLSPKIAQPPRDAAIDAVYQQYFRDLRAAKSEQDMEEALKKFTYWCINASYTEKEVNDSKDRLLSYNANPSW